MKDAKVTNWLAKRGIFDHATPADIYVHTASGQTESQSLGNVVGVGIPDGEMTTLLEGQNYDGPYGIKACQPACLPARLRPTGPDGNDPRTCHNAKPGQ